MTKKFFLKGTTCYCAPVISKFEKRLEKNKRELTRHLEDTHGRLANRITQMERRTKDQFSNLSNSMKENFAQVRNQVWGRYFDKLSVFRLFTILYGMRIRAEERGQKSHILGKHKI